MAAAEHLDYSLRPYTPRDAWRLPRLVKSNISTLKADFPNVIGNHRSRLASFATIHSVRTTGTTRAFTVREQLLRSSGGDDATIDAIEHGMAAAPKIVDRPIGCATATLGVVHWGPERIAGVGIAGWLDAERVRQGIGSKVGTILLAEATKFAHDNGLSHLFTVVRPENFVSTALVEKLGLERVGAPSDYSTDMGDSVTTPRQLFIKPIE